MVASFQRNTAPIPKRCTVSVSSSPSSRLRAALGLILSSCRKHKRLVQAVLFTGIYFIVYIYGLRAWRHQFVFWPSICILFLFHVLGVFFYSNQVEPILVWQWPLVGLVEYYGAAFFLDWATPRFGHDARHKPANVEPGT